MEKMKIQIELNNRPYNMDLLFVAVSMRGGFATRNYILEETSHFVSNCAFYNILFNYFRTAYEVAGLHFDVQRAVSTVSFCKKKTELISVLNGVLYTLFNHEYNLEKFENAKQSTKDAFVSRYQDGAFRSKYKGIEFSDLNKHFTLKQLINDIEIITYEEFVKCTNTLLVPGNVCVYISGETDELDFSSILLPDYGEQYAHTVRIAGFGFDPYLRQDAHITNIAREDHNLIIECFDFFNTKVTNFSKQLIVELSAELIPAHDTDVWVDSLDSSIMFSTKKLCSYKELLYIDNEKSYTAAHVSLLNRYTALLESNPEHFAIKAATLMTIGVYMDQYLSFLDKCSFDMFKEICEKADYKISEAQIALRKESK